MTRWITHRITRRIALISYFHRQLSLQLARGMPRRIARQIACRCSLDYASAYSSEWIHYFNGVGNKVTKGPRCEHHNNSGKRLVLCTLVTRNVPGKCRVMACFQVCRPDCTSNCTTVCTHFLLSSSAFPADHLRDDSSDCSHFLLSSTAFPATGSHDASSDCALDCSSECSLDYLTNCS